MFNLESEIRKWRQSMAAAHLTPETLAELEEHLREDIERQMRAGIDAVDALRAAMGRMGEPNALRQEFALAGRTNVVEALRQQKWKLLLCTAAGVVAAIVFHLIRPATYQSNTKFLIRYVIAPAAPAAQGPRSIAPDVSAEIRQEVMMEEMEILRSTELAQRVAEKIGPTKIIGGPLDDTSLVRAANAIERGLKVSVIANSSVVSLSFRHPDRGLTQAILREVVDQYLRLHVETHRAANLDGLVSPGKVSNISLISPASWPQFDIATLLRLQALPIVAGILTGLVWVLLRRAYDDRSRFAR
jgi:uncharacterized protein involved in exopolysaccharide biosynthesis